MKLWWRALKFDCIFQLVLGSSHGVAEMPPQMLGPVQKDARTFPSAGLQLCMCTLTSGL